MKRTALLVLPLLAMFSSPMQAGDKTPLPTPFTAVYTVKKAGLTLGDVKIRLQLDEQRYRYDKETRSRGLLALFRKDVIHETSEGRIANGRLTMDRYEYLHEGGKGRKTHRIRLVPPNRILEEYKGKHYDYEVPPNTLDRSSVEIALMRDAGPAVEHLSYTIADRGRSKKLDFVKLGKQQRKTDAGRFDCIEYRVERKNHNRSTTLCIAPELGNLPVTITHVEKGTSFTMWLKSYHPDAPH